MNLLGALAVRYPGGLNDRVITAHVVDQPDKAAVENAELLVEQGVGLSVDRVCHIVCPAGGWEYIPKNEGEQIILWGLRFHPPRITFDAAIATTNFQCP